MIDQRLELIRVGLGNLPFFQVNTIGMVESSRCCHSVQGLCRKNHNQTIIEAYMHADYNLEILGQKWQVVKFKSRLCWPDSWNYC